MVEGGGGNKGGHIQALHFPVSTPLSLNDNLELQILAALLKLTVLNISCTHSAAELLSFSI